MVRYELQRLHSRARASKLAFAHGAPSHFRPVALPSVLASAQTAASAALGALILRGDVMSALQLSERAPVAASSLVLVRAHALHVPRPTM